MSTKNTPAFVDILSKILSNEQCVVFPLQLKLFFTFCLLKLFVLTILMSQVLLVIFHERIKVILVFEIFCHICISKMYLNRKNVSMCPNSGCQGLPVGHNKQNLTNKLLPNFFS